MNSALYVRRFRLNLIRDLIGNQYSDLRRGYLTLSLPRQGNYVHAANLFYIFSEQPNSNELQ